MPVDAFSGHPDGLLNPYKRAAAVTPANGTELSFMPRALWIGGAGNISVTMADGNVRLISGIPAGTLLPIRVKTVESTSTTATLIVALD